MYEAKCLVMDYQQTNSMHQQHLHQLHSFAPAAAAAAADASSRWTQYQQLWRQHQMFINGKSCGKDSPEKKDDNELLWSNVEAQAALLGPNIWDNKNLSYDTDLKYCDLDEFLSDNGIPLESQPAVGGAVIPTQQAKLDTTCLPQCAVTQPQTNGIIPKREPSPSPSEPLSPLGINPPSPADSTLSFASSSRDFDPRSRPFSDEELKPQPMVKKSRKQFVPDGLKDEKYWARRRKNNMAAKRSRDARRLKENQIAMRAGFLEKEVSRLQKFVNIKTAELGFTSNPEARNVLQIMARNLGLRQEMERLKRENMALRDRLSKFTDV